MKRKPVGGKAAARRPSKKGASPQHSINTQTHPDAPGIDVGAEELVVAVPPGRCEEPDRTFTSGGLQAGAPERGTSPQSPRKISRRTRPTPPTRRRITIQISPEASRSGGSVSSDFHRIKNRNPL